MKVYCVNPGYSMQACLHMWEKQEYVGHLLYGITYLEQRPDMELVFQDASKGHKKIKLLDRLLYEWRAIKESLKCNCDIVYAPCSNYILLMCLMKWLKLYRKKIVAVVHITKGLTEQKKLLDAPKWLYIMMGKTIDKMIFINPYAYRTFVKRCPHYAHKARLDYLAPEPIAGPKEHIKSAPMVVSIGKTRREYKVLIDALKDLPKVKGVIVSNTQDLVPYKGRYSNITIVDHLISHEDTFRYYKECSAVVVPVRETPDGVYGLSSILDAMAFCKPVIVARTRGIGIPVDDWGIGATYTPGSVQELKEAIHKYCCDAAAYQQTVARVEKLTETFTIDGFGARLADDLLLFGKI